VKKALALIAALFSAAPLPPSWPPKSENASATRLQSTVERFGDDLSTIRRGQVTVAFLAKHANTIRTLRAEIVSDEPPVWSLDAGDILEAPYPPLRMHMRLFSILAADALAQKNTPVAWADLHAIWILSRSLLQRPENISVRTALLGRRRIEAVAAQIASPRPAWWGEYDSFDTRAPIARSIDYEAWRIRAFADRYPLGEPDGSLFDSVRDIAAPFARPIRILQANLEIAVEDRQSCLSGQARLPVLHSTK
jgi:hypothetical protein